MTRHLKRMAAPKTWPVNRKKNTYIARPFPGAHTLEEGMPLGVFLREMLGLAKTRKEVRQILHHKNVLVDGRKRVEQNHLLGLFDVLELTDIGAHYRVTINTKGKIDIIPIEKSESASKPCRIRAKSMVRGKVQLNMTDGRNIFVDKDSYKTGDTLIIELPSQAIKKHLKLDKKAVIFLTGGKYLGHIGTVEGISGDRLMYKTEDGQIAETRKEYAFVIGEGKPALTVSKKK